jgi:hypothetical protein
VDNNDERRADKRFDKSEDISLKIVFSSENPGLLGKTMSGETLDVSASGMRISMERAIKIDSVLDVWVTLHDQNKKYFLTGNVRWCRPSEAGKDYQVGLVLRERTDTVTDLSSWQEAFRK